MATLGGSTPSLHPACCTNAQAPYQMCDPLLQLLDHNKYNVTDYHDELDNGAASAEPKPDLIK